MVAVHSQMLPLGTQAPDFSLPDAVTGDLVTRDSLLGGAGLLVMFICNHCPYVVHIMDAVGDVAAEALKAGVRVIAINANDVVKYPQDGPAAMKNLADRKGWAFPFALDADQSVAKAYTAACTPDFFLFDGTGALFYRGQLDSARPRNDLPVTHPPRPVYSGDRRHPRNGQIPADKMVATRDALHLPGLAGPQRGGGGGGRKRTRWPGAAFGKATGLPSPCRPTKPPPAR